MERRWLTRSAEPPDALRRGSSASGRPVLTTSWPLSERAAPRAPISHGRERASAKGPQRLPAVHIIIGTLRGGLTLQKDPNGPQSTAGVMASPDLLLPSCSRVETSLRRRMAATTNDFRSGFRVSGFFGGVEGGTGHEADGAVQRVRQKCSTGERRSRLYVKCINYLGTVTYN